MLQPSYPEDSVPCDMSYSDVHCFSDGAVRHISDPHMKKIPVMIPASLNIATFCRVLDVYPRRERQNKRGLLRSRMQFSDC